MACERSPGGTLKLEEVDATHRASISSLKELLPDGCGTSVENSVDVQPSEPDHPDPEHWNEESSNPFLVPEPSRSDPMVAIAEQARPPVTRQ